MPSPLDRTRRLASALALLTLGACATEDVSLPLPTFEDLEGKDKRKAANVLAECDDLPELSDEELRRPPFSPPSLEKTAPRTNQRPPAFLVLPDVELKDAVSDKVEAIDAAFAKRTGKHITVTSGTRDAARQAKAMYKMLRLGGDPMKLYRNKEAAREIKHAYESARARGKTEEEVVTSMYSVIQGQIAKGVYISAHLRAGAVDIRSRFMSAAEKKAFAAAVSEAKGTSLLEEQTPPHFHLQIE